MSAVFTQHAVDRMQERSVDRSDVDRLLGIIDRVSEAPGGLERSPDVALVRNKGGEAVYLVRAGSLRAVLMAKPGPDGGRDAIVVANVYRRDEEIGSLSGPPEAPIAAQAG